MMAENASYEKIKKILGTYGFEEIARGLLQVEEFLVKEFAYKAPTSFQSELIRVIRAGGKRIRPLLVLICGKLGEFDIKQLVVAASCIEAVHTASLIHDDIIDNANFRRGAETTFKRFGKDFAIKVGDYLFARSFEVLSEIGNMRSVESLATAAEDLSLGELDGSLLRWSLNVKLEDYLNWIGRKTASLFRSSCEVGALVSGASLSDVKKVSDFGFLLGIAFQLFDDVLDLTGSTEILGKPAGSDLKEGFLTLPYLLAIEDEYFKDRIVKAIRKESTEEEVDILIKEVASSRYTEEAKNTAADFVNKAAQAIENIENETVKEFLLSVGNYVIQRYY
ncbi:MAG: polyprenyl synthetase family protein [Actinobacteria bacterium]|nr:polyprenyl synthetase family protein [Actinomycetota bacterium]